jgi:hypothetical protein
MQTISWYYDSNTTSSGNYYTYTDNVDEWITDEIQWIKPTLRVEDVNVNTCALKAEETIETWLTDNYDKYELLDCGSYIYDVIQEHAYEVVSDIVAKLSKDVDLECEDDEVIIQAVLNEIDFDALYDVVEDIINAPITMEDKLAEIGMSYRDFL